MKALCKIGYELLNYMKISAACATKPISVHIAVHFKPADLCIVLFVFVGTETALHTKTKQKNLQRNECIQHKIYFHSKV